MVVELNLSRSRHEASACRPSVVELVPLSHPKLKTEYAAVEVLPSCDTKHLRVNVEGKYEIALVLYWYREVFHGLVALFKA
jgi:hypothetical protein